MPGEENATVSNALLKYLLLGSLGLGGANATISLVSNNSNSPSQEIRQLATRVDFLQRDLDKLDKELKEQGAALQKDLKSQGDALQDKANVIRINELERRLARVEKSYESGK